MATKKRTKRPGNSGCLFKRREGGPWLARWFDHTGRRREASTFTTDRAAAERILAKRTGDAALRRDNVIDPRTDRYTAAERKPLSAHLDDWQGSLTAKNVTPKQVKLVRTRVDALVASLGAERLSDLTASAVQAAIGELHADGVSLQTCQHYLRGVKQFARWLRRDGRTRDDALTHLEGYNADTDRKYERRPLEGDELARLIRAAESGPQWHGMSGPDRAMLYRLAAGTGFRRGELCSLTPASFHLGDEGQAIELQASSSKRRRADRQPIRADLADVLRPWLDGKPEGAPVFATLPERTAPMIRADLRRARAGWIRETPNPVERRERRASGFLAEVDEAGRLVDFHALRATFITLLVRGGASVKAAQELARHSTPMLTMNTYTKLGVHDLGAALDTMPNVEPVKPELEAQRATGTDGRAELPRKRPEGRKRLKYTPDNSARQSARDEAMDGDTRRELEAPEVENQSGAEVAQDGRKSGFSRGEPSPGTKATDRIRTDDLRFTKPRGIDASAAETTSPETPPTIAPDNQPPIDPDLGRLVEAWPELPEPIRAGILAMVRSVQAKGGV